MRIFVEVLGVLLESAGGVDNPESVGSQGRALDIFGTRYLFYP